MQEGAIAWVESPLQLLGALEHAALASTPLVIVPRAGDAQLERTVTHLAERVDDGSRFAIDRRVLPARLFTDGAPWLVGDAYSGQVQLRLERARPRALTLVDDGGITRLLAEHLDRGQPLLRPRAPRVLAGVRSELATRTTRRLLGLASEGRLAVTTYLASNDPAVLRLRALGAIVTTHRFDRTRQWGAHAASVPPDARILLGTARVVDGLDAASTALQAIAHLAHAAPLAYLPHRREPRWFLEAVARLPRVSVLAAELPIELALAGTPRPLDIVAGASTAAETLPVVLRGTGSTVLPSIGRAEVAS
jgi:hypothetical protein